MVTELEERGFIGVLGLLSVNSNEWVDRNIGADFEKELTDMVMLDESPFCEFGVV